MCAATESQIMTNVIASPIAMSNVREKHGRVRVDICRVQAVVGDAAGHLYRLTKLRANDAVISIKLLHLEADAGMSDLNVGIWTPSKTTADPVLVDVDGLIDGHSATGAQSTFEELLGFGSNAGAEADFGKGLWEYCPGGPATEPAPGTEYEIVVQSVGNPGATVNMVWAIQYMAGD